MAVQVSAEGEVMHDVAEVLLQHLSPAKAVRFWASWRAEHWDYLKWRDEEFGAKTVTTLYESITTYQENQPAFSAASSADRQ